MTTELIEFDTCSRTDVHPGRSDAEKAIETEPKGADGPRRAVRCALHSHSEDASVFHVTDMPVGRHRKRHR